MSAPEQNFAELIQNLEGIQNLEAEFMKKMEAACIQNSKTITKVQLKQNQASVLLPETEVIVLIKKDGDNV